MSEMKYIIIPATDLDEIKFNQVAESKDTIRYKLDNSEFIVKVQGTIPVDLESYISYTHTEIINLINNPANGWIEQH
tara:strand:+ start:353 stop:583 length:231 start_codon:yes stop_codon:yes gene_type:complete